MTLTPKKARDLVYSSLGEKYRELSLSDMVVKSMSIAEASGFLDGVKWHEEKVKGLVEIAESFKGCRRYKDGDGACVACIGKYF